MPGNTIGKLFRLTSFGESHGKAIGGIIDGCPSGLYIDIDYIQDELRRRRPGQSLITTSRSEDDEVELLSGIFEGKTTGTPIGFVVWNKNQDSSDYDNMRDVFRPSHADYSWETKYGIRDYRGGGRSSAREHISRVVGGAFAKIFLKQFGINIVAYTSQVGDIKLDKKYDDVDIKKIEKNIVRCPDEEKANAMIELIHKIKKEGNTVGGMVSCIISGLPVGLGEPVFEKLHARLAQAMMSINAAKGFEYGSGFNTVTMLGSMHNDVFVVENDKIKTKTNLSGGVQGGVSNGENIYFNVAFKPVATLLKEQQTVDKYKKEITLKAKGRHDACVVPRAVPVVEAMAAMVIADAFLENKVNQCFF